MQSGIQASQDLKTAFTDLLTSPSTRGLLATITNESLTPSSTLSTQSPSSTLTTDLSSLSSLLSDTQAAYILLRADPSPQTRTPKCIAVTYVPDAAPVRQKMLFASTRLTLVRELGSEHFGSTLFATTKEELSPTGWAAHEAHGKLDAPLTEEERSLEGIKEAERTEGGGTAGRALAGGEGASGVSMGMEEGAVQALRGLGAGGGAVVLVLNLKTEQIALHATHPSSSAGASTLSSLIPTSTPSFTFYKHAPSNKVLFVYCCPAGCSVKERMTYAASSRGVPGVATREAGVTVDAKMEVSEMEELGERDVLREVEPEGTGGAGVGAAVGAAEGGGRGFARPKRPGRR